MKIIKIMVLIMTLSILLIPLVTQGSNKPLAITSTQSKPLPKIVNACMYCTGCCFFSCAIPTYIITNACLKNCCPNQHKALGNVLEKIVPSSKPAPQRPNMDEVD